MVPTCSGDLESSARHGLPAHIAHIGNIGDRSVGLRSVAVRPFGRAGEGLDHARQTRGTEHP